MWLLIKQCWCKFIIALKFTQENHCVWHLESLVSCVIVCPGCQKNRENWSSLIRVKPEDKSHEAGTEKGNNVAWENAIQSLCQIWNIFLIGTLFSLMPFLDWFSNFSSFFTWTFTHPCQTVIVTDVITEKCHSKLWEMSCSEIFL